MIFVSVIINNSPLKILGDFFVFERKKFNKVLNKKFFLSRKALAFLFTLLISFAFTINANAEFNWHDQYAVGPYQGNHPSLAIGPDNKPYIAHIAIESGEKSLMFTYFKDGEWVTELVDGALHYERPTGFGCSLAVDEEGNFHISYAKLYTHGTAGNAIKYAYKEKTSTEWQITEVVDGDISSETALALDLQGKPHIIYDESISSGIHHAYQDNLGDWQEEFVDFALEANFPTMAIASEGLIYMAYEYYQGDPYNRYVALLNIGVPNEDEYDWYIQEITSDYSFESGRGLGIALDSFDRPHVVRYYADGKDLWYFKNVDGEWEKEIIDSNGDVGKHCSIAIDKNDNIFVAYNQKYSGESGALKVAYKMNGDASWTIETVDSNIEPDPDDVNDSYYAGTSIKVNSAGCPYVAYYNDHNPDRAGVRFIKHVRGTENAPGPGFIATSPGPNPYSEENNESGAKVKVYWHDGYPFSEFNAYGTDKLGVNVACGDVDGDGVDEIVTGPGPGQAFGPQVRVFEADGTPVIGGGFFAYGTFNYGVNVSTGDIDGDGVEEIVTGAGPGAVFGPHVRAFELDGTPVPGVSFFAYGTNKYGVNVTCADIDGDGYDEIITGAGPGEVFGPHVRAWNYDGEEITAISQVSFLAYGTNKFGVNVTAGDIDQDGYAEIITGPGPGSMFGPHVRAWNYDNDQVGVVSNLSFMAFDDVLYGANVSCGDVTGDEIADIAVGVGDDPQGPSSIKIYKYTNNQKEQFLSLTPFASTYGVNLAIGANNPESEGSRMNRPNAALKKSFLKKILKASRKVDKK